MIIRGVIITLTQLAVLLSVWLVFTLSATERMVVPPVLPMLSKELSLSAVQAAGYMSIYYFGYVCTQLPGGLLTDRFGPRKVLLGSLFVMGCTTVLMYTVTSYEMGLFYRLLTGIGSGAIMSSCMRSIFENFPGKGRGSAVGIFMTASSSGLTLANFMVPLVADLYGWRSSFLITGVAPLLVLIIVYFFLKEYTTDEERSAQHKANPNEFWTNLVAVSKNKNIWKLGASNAFANAATWGTAIWANTYMNKVMGVSLVEAGMLMGTFGVAAIICKPFSGVLADMVGLKRKYLLSLLLLIFAPLLIWFGINKDIGMLKYVVPILGLFAFAYSPVVHTLVGDIVPLHLSGSGTGLWNLITQLGPLIAPLAVGFILDSTNNDYFWVFAFLAVCAIIAAFTALSIKVPQQIAEQV